MNPRRLMIILAVFAAGLLVWVLTSGVHSQPTGGVGAPPQGRLFKVQRGEVRLGVRTTGSLQPKEFVPVTCAISAKIEWLIDEGTRVKAGDEIARLDDTEYRDALEDAQLNLDVVKTDDNVARVKVDYIEGQGKRNVSQARIQLELAQIDLTRLQNPDQSTVALSQLDLELARLVLEAATRENERLRGLADKGIVDQRQVALSGLRLEGARVAHAKAKVDYDLLLAGTPVEDLAVAQERVKRAQTVLDLAGKKTGRDKNLALTALAIADGEKGRTEQTIDVQRRRTESAHVKAPKAGTVIYPRPWGTPARVGDPVWRGSRILDVADIDVTVAEGLVNQADWPNVHVGQDVDVVLVAAPDRHFTGKVVELGGLAADRYLTAGGDVTGVMTFRLLVQVNESDPLLRPTYSAYLTVISEQHKDVLWVPRTALASDHEGKPVIWVYQSGRTVGRPVQIGACDAVNVIITAGLQPGETVVVPNRK